MKTNKYIKSIDRENANIEVEDGEFVKSGMFINEAKGKKHNPNPLLPGGIPIRTNSNHETVVVSNAKDMPVTNKGLLSMFRMENKKGKVTYSDLMRKADLSTYKDIAALYDPYSTDLEKSTAIHNIYNKNDKANLIIAAQELNKGELPPESTVGSLMKRGITPEDIIPNGLVAFEEPQMPVMRCSGKKKYGYGGSVDDFELFNQIKSNLNLSDADKNKTNSQLLGDYGQQLIDIYNHFTDNPKELDKLYDNWKGSQSVKDNKFDIPKDKFLKQYILWLYSKQAFKTTGEGGQDWSGKQAGSKSQSGQELNKRNASKSGYAETFADFAGIGRGKLNDNIKFYQTMDIAMNDYAKGFSDDNISVSTNDFSPEDEASNAGYASTTGQGGRQGVSVADGLFGQRTADFLPYIIKKEKKEGDNTEYDHVDEYEEPYDDRFFRQDINNLLLAARNRANIRQPHYMLPNYTAQGIQPHYQDYRNLAYQAASNAASLASAMGPTVDPTARVAMANSLADRVNTATANALSQEQMQNVNTANQFEAQNAQIANALAAQRSGLAKRYFDETEIGEQQKANSVAKANEEITKTLNKAMSNVEVRELLRKNNYRLTPDGRIIYTGDNRKLDPQAARKSEIVENMDMLINDYHIDPADAARIVYGSKKSANGKIDLDELAKYMQG